MTDLRYPIGRFQAPDTLTLDQRRTAIAEIEAVPQELRQAVAGLSDVQLDTAYRPAGWTVRQVVHHLPDSHLNSYVRFKLALTEEEPTIRTYDEVRWADLPDSTASVEISLALLDALHRRWVLLLGAIPDSAWSRRLHHPEMGMMSLETLLALYAWHGRHHVAHITSLRQREGW